MAPQKQKSHAGFEPKPTHHHASLHFPAGFLWGSATSAHQVEGWNDQSDWWEWEHRAGTIADGQMSGRAADHYHRFHEDFDAAQMLGQNIHRLSIEWARIEPSPGKFDEDAIAHYREVLGDLHRRDIKTMVTLFHFSLPLWFAKRGGFAKKENLPLFENYLRKIIPEIQHLVDYWITINEPNVYVLMSYALGVWPPGEFSYRQAWRVYRHLARVHRQTYRLIHDLVRSPETKVGIALNVISFAVEDKHSWRDWFVMRITDWAWNHTFLELTRGTHDFLGVNYYVHRRIRRQTSFRALIHQLVDGDEPIGREASDLDWEIYPPGIYEALQDMGTYRLPIIVTENGISSINDDRRSRYIVSYLKELYHAMQSGVDVRGYLYWSLLDNFEWDKGLKARFGLIEVDFDTLKRTIRPSAYVYRRICTENAIHHDLLRFIGHSARREHRPRSEARSAKP